MAGGSSDHNPARDPIAAPESARGPKRPAATVRANHPGQPYVTRTMSSRDQNSDSDSAKAAASASVGSDASRKMRVEHALLLAKVLELQAAAAEQGQDLVGILQKEQAEMIAVLERDPEPEAEQQPGGTVLGLSTPQPEPEQELAAGSWEQKKESVERLLNCPAAGWAHTTGQTLEHSPAESASDATVKRPVAFAFAGRAFFFGTQAGALEALLAYNVRRLYRKILLVWAKYLLRTIYIRYIHRHLHANSTYKYRMYITRSRYVQWVQHYACRTRDADSSVELYLLLSTPIYSYLLLSAPICSAQLDAIVQFVGFLESQS